MKFRFFWFSPHAPLLCMAEGRGGGRESAMQRVQIPRRRGHGVTYTACLLPWGNWSRVRLSRLATIWSFYLHLAGEPQNTNTRAGETRAAGATPNRRYHRFYRCDGGHHLQRFIQFWDFRTQSPWLCYKMSSDFVIQGLKDHQFERGRPALSKYWSIVI